MKQVFCFSKPELWYPYSEPRAASDGQDAAEGSDYFAINFADSTNPPRLDRLILGS